MRYRKSANPVAAYRTVAVAGEILFTGAFVFVAAAFAATVYAWRHL